MHYSKSAWCIQTIYNQMTALLSDICHFWVRAECKLKLASYGSIHTLQSLSYPYFVHIYTYNLKTTGRILCKDILLTKQLLYYQRCLFSVFKLHVRCFVSFGSYMCNMHRGLFQYDVLCVLTLISQKLQVCIVGYGYFWVRAACELWFQTRIAVSFWHAVCVYFHA